MYKKLNLLLWITMLLGACTTVTPQLLQAPETTQPFDSMPLPSPLPSPTLVLTTTPIPTQLPSPTPAAWDREGWNIVWHDEFDSDKLDQSNWNFDIGDHGWGNNEWQMYTSRSENVRVQNGLLVIEAREDPSLHTKNPYSSARIKTQGLHTWQYGRIEARVKLPYGQGIWPAFWMKGDNNQAWPASGEIDIFEYVGSMPNSIYAHVHGPGYSDSSSIGSDLVLSADALKDNFHVYAIEWQENEIRWLFDEKEYFKVTPADLPGKWVFDHPFFIIMNLSVGGDWPGYPDKTTIFPQFMNVDYVRVYQRP